VCDVVSVMRVLRCVLCVVWCVLCAVYSALRGVSVCVGVLRVACCVLLWDVYVECVVLIIVCSVV